VSGSTARTATARAPSARASNQRTRVLEAAKKCFIDSGFHAASMADIAATADISVGLIYRYFANKSAIVKAIIDHHLEQGECRMMMDRIVSPEDVVEAILAAFERWRGEADPEVHAALFLEITAEATRDPEIAAAVRKANEVMRSGLSDMLRRYARSSGIKLDAAALRGRVNLLQCLVEGLAVRSIREPDLDRASLRTALEQCVLALLAETRT
jgi:AcrR family transcriptional regulator